MDKLAVKYGKHDIERVGLFVEMPILPARGKKLPRKKLKTAIGENLRSILAGGPKTKCGNMDGYFGDQFTRVFGNEARKKKEKKKDSGVKTPFVPTGPGKWHSCPGDYYGNFGGIIAAMSRKPRAAKKGGKKEATKPNPLTGPGKKGGPGYVNITLGPYPPHGSERVKKTKMRRMGPGAGKPALVTMHWPKPYFYPNPYCDPLKDPPSKALYSPPPPPKLDKSWLLKPVFVPVGPAKHQGGSHAGCFDRWPEHKADKYLSPAQIAKFVSKKKGTAKAAAAAPLKPNFVPPFVDLKTMFTRPTLANTAAAINHTNWNTYKPNFVKYLV